jgi:o-succinylbenzoate---CoA ligase
VAREGETVLLPEVRSALAGLLPPPALPRQVVQVAALPMLASGKPDRSAARALAATGSADAPRTDEEN